MTDFIHKEIAAAQSVYTEDAGLNLDYTLSVFLSKLGKILYTGFSCPISGKQTSGDPIAHAFFYEAESGTVYAAADLLNPEQRPTLNALINNALHAQAALEALPPKKCWSPEAVLQAYDAGNRAICDQIGKIGKRSGATLTTLLLAEGEAYAANIGDSRCYLYRDGCLSRLSEDHTAVQRLIALGIIEPAEAKTHPERHRLTQHLGIFPDELIIQPHTVRLPVRPGDRFLLCSDGLTDLLEEEDLSALLRSQTAAPACAAALYQLAMQRGGKDNISVLLVGIDR